MANASKGNPIPSGYTALRGSEVKPPPGAKLLGPADPREAFKVSIVLRRRTDRPPPPSFDHFARVPRGERKRMSEAAFADRFGAHPHDVGEIEQFAKRVGLRVKSTHLARRIVELTGTVAEMSKAFGVTLHRYERTVERRVARSRVRVPEIYRGHEGPIHVPRNIAALIVGVFGLDTRTVTQSNMSVDPPNTLPLTVQQITTLYNFPTNSAEGQTIGILSPTGANGGFIADDMQSYFGASLPTITAISVDGFHNNSSWTTTGARAAMGTTTLVLNAVTGVHIGSAICIPSASFTSHVTAISDPEHESEAVLAALIAAGNSRHYSEALIAALAAGAEASIVTLNEHLPSDVARDSVVYVNPDSETTQDIQIAGAAAPGAGINVFFSGSDRMGWVDLISRAVTPEPGEPHCSVLSSSFLLLEADDSVSQPSDVLEAITMAFQDAANHFITICVSSGDWGANAKAGHYPVPGYDHDNPQFMGDGKQHVLYPASDPWALAVGGTTIGNVDWNHFTFEEYVWNDPDPITDATLNFEQFGTTGGGVSAYFPLPPYQENAGVPVSLRDGRTGRGVPDVAGNASLNSFYQGIIVAGEPFWGNGTSASTPLWAGLLAVINARIGAPMGFINPLIYRFGPSGFRDINGPPGPTDNSNNGIAGYAARPGWDACTGWGSPNGVALLEAIAASL